MKVFQQYCITQNINVSRNTHNRVTTNRRSYSNLPVSHLNFLGVQDVLIKPVNLKRILELQQLKNLNPQGGELYKKIDKLLPLTSNESFLTIATLLTPFNDNSLDSIIVEKFSELFLFVKNNKKNITEKDIANYTLNSFKINKYKNSVEFLPEIMSFIKKLKKFSLFELSLTIIISKF